MLGLKEMSHKSVEVASARAATAGTERDLRRDARALDEFCADLTPKNRPLKKA